MLKRAEVLITYVLSGFWFEHIVTPDPSLSPLKKLRVAAGNSPGKKPSLLLKIKINSIRN